MSERNHWITFVGHQVARWGAIFPPPAGDAEALIRFGVSLVASGKQHRVWDPHRIPGRVPYVASKQTFEDYLRQSVLERQRIPIVPWDRFPGPELWAPGTVAFYKDGEIVEEPVGDLGALLRELRPGRTSSISRGTSPVVVHGMAPELHETSDIVIEIRLDSDIWFPRVLSIFEMDPLVDADLPDSYDNRELAERHTPRLNAFLNEVRDVTLTLGGRWEKLDVDGISVNYVDLWDESGIRL